MGMDWQTQPTVDPALLAAAASKFASYPGAVSDSAAKDFLDNFPLPVIFSTLEKGGDVDDTPGLESAVVDALERIFKTNYGVALLIYAMPYAKLGLTANSPLVRRLACFAISRLLEHSKDEAAGMQAVADSGVARPLLMAVADGDGAVAAAAMDALMNLAKSPAGLELLFSDKGAGAGSLKEMVTSGSATIRIRVFSIAQKLFGISEATAAAVQQSGVLSVLESELDNRDDILAQINALELLQELACTPNGAHFLVAQNLVGRLISIIGNPGSDPLVRSRAISVGAKLLSFATRSSDNQALPLEDIQGLVQAIGSNMEKLKATGSTSADVTNEQETVLDALGQIGTSFNGAELLLLGATPTARLIVEATISRRGGIVLAGVHALAAVAGAERSESPLLSSPAEASLRELVYEVASVTPSGWIWNLLQQSSEVRLATYRLIGPLVARPWVLREVCSRKELIDFVADPHTEAEKAGMEWRHASCAAMSSALSAAVQRGDSYPVEILEKLEAAARRGPYLARGSYPEPSPLVITAERF